MGAQGKPLTPQEKETIILIKNYFDRVRGGIQEQECSSVQRTANALGVGIATVKQVLADHNRGVTFAEQTEASRGHRTHTVPDSLQTITREYIRGANIEGVHITLEMLCQHLEGTYSVDEFSIRTLGRTLDRWGFTFGKGTRSQ